MPSTAPKWAQEIGLTTRNQALQFQAYAMGFDSRPQFERARAQILSGATPETRTLWRRLLVAQTRAEILLQTEHTGKAVHDAIELAQALKSDLNGALPSEHRMQSPKARAG